MTRLGLRQRGLIASAAASRQLSNTLMGTVLAVYVGQIGAPFAVSLVMTAYFVGLMLFAPVWGAIADVTGRRRAVLVVTGVATVLSLVPLFLAGGVWTPIGVRGIYSMASAGFAPIMLSIASAHGGATGRGREIGFFNSAWAVGFTAGQVGAGVLLGLFAPTWVFAVIAVAYAVSTILVAFLSDPTPTPETEPTLAEVVSEVRRRLLPAVEDRAHLKSHGLRWLYVALAFRNMTVLGVGSLLAPYLLTSVGVTPFVMGIVLAFNPAAQTMFMYVFGRIADAIGRKPLIVLGMAGASLHALLAAAATLPADGLARTAVAGASLFVLGTAYASMTSGALAFIGDVVPDTREGEMMGLRSTAKGVGGMLGPPLTGALATVAGHETAFAAGSVLALVAALIAAVGLTESRPDVAGRASPADD